MEIHKYLIILPLTLTLARERGGCFQLQVHTCGTIAPMVLLTLLEVGGLECEPHRLGVSRSVLASPWYVAQYSWDIEVVGLHVGFWLAVTGLN